jgi:Predicted choloylglycine hydrolase
MQKTFYAVAEERPGPIWRQQFHGIWPDVRAWYLKEGLAARPTPAEGRATLARYMPEMVEIYDLLCRLAGDDEVAHRMLSGVNPPPVITGCSQTAWLGAGGPRCCAITISRPLSPPASWRRHAGPAGVSSPCGRPSGAASTA